MASTHLGPVSDHDLVAVVLRPSRRKWLMVLAVCLGLTGIGLMMTRDPDPFNQWAGWLSIAFFGGGGALIVPHVFSNRSHLRLHAEGFHFATLRRTSDYRWSEITASFGVVRISRNDLVMFNTARPATRTARLNQGFCGYDYGLPDTYGMKAEELAALMTRFWWRATGQ